jgi:hypothetical protein
MTYTAKAGINQVFSSYALRDIISGSDHSPEIG